MGENLSYQPFAESQRGSITSYPPRSLATPVFDSTDLNGDEEPYTIRCICDYTDDDGNTVLCEVCNTWQHISCYYFPKDRLDADDDHVCVVCKPHLHSLLDSAAANSRQQRHRGPAVNEHRPSRRAAPKSHRKSKTKDSIAVNGWNTSNNASLDHPQSHGQADAQSNNGGLSPRDQYGPPAKRPKTSHRHSGSLTSNSLNRSRGPSNIKRMPPISELPSDYFSPAFLRIHRENGDCKPATGNLHLTIDVANLLSTWLDDPSTFEAVTNGKRHNDILQRADGTIEELETVPIEKRVERQADVLFHGKSPIWPYLTAQRDVAPGELIGELKGGIGHQQEYKADPANQWSKLHHPDHFVFFHPALPIYIDCRSEGTMLRYVRRSCRPNLRMSTIITGERDYHFCFTALQDIPAGAEITVNWDPDPETRWDPKDGDMTEAVREQFCGRAETLLSHFGGCACGTDDCLMLHFDRRIPFVPVESNHDAESRTAKNGKKRKSSKRSPPDASTLDASRASSEAVTHGDIDDDVEDVQSLSHSAGSKPSRDNTPSGVNGTSEKLSERERRKLQQQERLFEQMESHQQLQGSRKKKRVSGSNPSGTNGDTGSAIRPSQKRARASSSNPNTPAQSARPTPYFGVSTPARSPDEPWPPRTTRPSSVLSPPPPPMTVRIYVDAGTQVDSLPDPPSAAPPSAVQSPALLHPRARCPSLSKRLLRKSLSSRARRVGLEQTQNAAEPPSATDIDRSPDVDQIMTDLQATPFREPTDGTDAPQQKEIATKDTGAQDGASSPLQPPAPPWQAETDVASSDLSNSPSKTTRPSNGMHVDLPPPPKVLAKLGIGDETAVVSPDGTGPNGNGPVPSQPPAASGPLQPPANPEMAPATAAPVKKKMSLSAYMNMRKAEKAGDLTSSSPVELKTPVMPVVAAAPAPAAAPPPPPPPAVPADAAKVKQEESNGDVTMESTSQG